MYTINTTLYITKPRSFGTSGLILYLIVKFSDGSMIAIDTIAVENEIADNMYQRSELDYFIYNAPLEYADLILNGDPKPAARGAYICGRT